MGLWYVRCEPCAYLASRLALSPNELKWASTWATSHRSTIGCVQNDFRSYGTFGANRAPILHWHKHYLQMDQNEIPHDPRHLWVPLRASKTISEPMVRSVQTVQVSCIKITISPNGPKRTSTWPMSPRSIIGFIQTNFCAYGTFSANHAPILCQDYTIFKWAKTCYHLIFVTLEYHRVHPKWFMCLWYVRWKPCTYLASRLHYLQIDRNKLPFETHHLGVPSGASERISEPMVCLAQTVHLSCVMITLSPNGLKWATT